MRNIIANTLDTFGRWTMLLGLFFLMWFSGFSLWEDGRLTDTACYLIILGVAVLTLRLYRLDRAVQRGEVAEDSLPFFLRNDW